MNFTYDAGGYGQLIPLVSSVLVETILLSTLLAKSSWIVPQSIMMPRSAQTRIPTVCPAKPEYIGLTFGSKPLPITDAIPHEEQQVAINKRMSDEGRRMKKSRHIKVVLRFF